MMDPRQQGRWASLHAASLDGSITESEEKQLRKLRRKLNAAGLSPRDVYTAWRENRLGDAETSRRIVAERQKRVDAGEDLTAAERKSLAEHIRTAEREPPPEFGAEPPPPAPSSSPTKTTPSAPADEPAPQSADGSPGRSFPAAVMWGAGVAIGTLLISGAVWVGGRLLRAIDSDDTDADLPSGSAANSEPSGRANVGVFG